MQLIDKLEFRDDFVSLIECFDDIDISFDEEAGWWITIDGAGYFVSVDAMNKLLNILRVPTKYVWRCTEEDGGRRLAEQTVKYWLQQNKDLSFLVENTGVLEVTQVFQDKRLYLPSVRINDFIIDHLGGNVTVLSHQTDNDLFYALYVTEDGDQNYTKGIQVVYSDCFNTTPRFDAVVYSPVWDAVAAWPTTGRKFRVAANTIPQVFDQIYEFIEIAEAGLKNELLPALDELDSVVYLTDPHEYTAKLCSELRIPNKIALELLEHADLSGSGNAFVWSLLNYLTYLHLHKESEIDLVMRRDIIVGISRDQVTGHFK